MINMMGISICIINTNEVWRTLKENKKSYHSNDYDEKHWTTKFTSNDDDLQLKKVKVCYITVLAFSRGQ